MPEADSGDCRRGAGRWLDVCAVALSAALGAAACASVGFRQVPLLFDNQVYFYIAERAASGLPPHLSEFDPKNALSMLASAAAIVVGRRFGVDDIYSMRALSVLVTVACFPLLWLLARRVSGSRLAAHIAVVAFTVFPGFFVLGTMGSRPKVFLVALMIASALAAQAGRMFALGLLATMCFLTWQPALIMLAAALVPALARVDRRSALLRLGAAAAVAVAVYEAYFAAYGVLGDQLYQSLVFPALYAKPNPGLLASMSRVLGFGSSFGVGELVTSLFALSLVVGWAALISRYRRLGACLRERGGAVYCLLCGSGALAFLLLDYQGYPDRFFIQPFAAVASGWMLWLPLRRVAALRDGGRGGAVALGAAALAASAALWLTPRPKLPYDLSVQRTGARVVGEMLDQGRSVYAIGCPHLLAMNRSENYLSYGFFPWRVREHLIALSRVEGAFTPARDGRWPDVVLTSRRDFELNRDWLQQRYRKDDREILRRQGVRVWTLRPETARP